MVTGTDDQKVTSTGYQKVTAFPTETPANKDLNNTPKKSLKKEKNVYSPYSEEFRLPSLLLSLIRQRRKEFREPDLSGWCIHMDRLISLDKRAPEEIERVIKWCQEECLSFIRNLVKYRRMMF